MNSKKIFALTILFFSISMLFSQEVSQERMIRIPLWAQMDVYPGYFDENISEQEKNNNKSNSSDSEYSIPIKKIREISPFMLEGMLYGWEFSYTPYDKARGVQEYFEFKPVYQLPEEQISRIKYAKPFVKDSRLYAWIEFYRDEDQISVYKSWVSILNPRIKGIGYAKLSEGFEGIQKATQEALKEAVRSYERIKIKTKPKEIAGKVLMTTAPDIGISAGRYKVTLEFFMETDRIEEYKTF